MKKTAKVLALALVVCLMMSVCVFASGEADFAQVSDTVWAGSSLTIQSVETAAEYDGYVDSTLYNQITKIVYDGGEIAVDAAVYTPILTVDGVQYDLYNAAGESFEGDVQITLAAKGVSANQGNSKFGDDAGSLIGSFYYIAAAYLDENGYEEANSVEAAQGGAEVSDTAITGMNFDSEGDYFSAVYVNGASAEISDSNFIAYGKGADDFTGQGIVVVAAGSSQLDIDNCVFETGGALRSAIWCGGSSTVNVTNTAIQSYNDEELVPYTTEDNYAVPMMQQVPFALGLTGNIRATLDAGQGYITFTDALVASNGWAVLSTDSGSGTLVATDGVAVVGTIEPAQEGTDYDLTYDAAGTTWGIDAGEAGELSGYIAYCDGFTDYAYGSAWYAPDYLVIITGGAVTIGASETQRFYGWSDRIGFMSHQTQNSTALSISESDFDIADTFLMIKSKGGNGETITLDDVTVNLYGENNWSGNLLEVIDSDDLGGGPGATTFTVPYGTYDEYLNAESGGEGGTTSLTITNSDLTGNIYDSVGSQTGSQTAFKNDGIAVALVDSSLTGAVSSTYGVHADEDGTLLLGTITVDSYEREGTYNYLAIGRIVNFAAPTVNNPVTLSLENSTWTVTGLSYVSELTVDDSSVVDGDIYVDGELVEGAGTYVNAIVVPAGADLAELEAAAVAAIEDATAAGIVPEDRSSLVANNDLGSQGSGSASGEASAEASDEAAASEEVAAVGGDTSNEAYHAYLKEYVDAVPAVSDEQYEEFCALIDADDFTTMPADMMFDATWWGYAAMTYDEFVAAGGVYEIPAFDPSLTAD